MKDGSFVKVKWQNLKVGTVVKLHDKEHLPADIIVLATSELNGEAYCSTATLDGERTLKPKQAVLVTQTRYKSE